MADQDDRDLWISSSWVFAHPSSPLGGGGPGRFSNPGPLRCEAKQKSDILPHPGSPDIRKVIASNIGTSPPAGATVPPNTDVHKLLVKGVIVAGGPLNDGTIDLINEAVKNQANKRYIAYETLVKVGGSIAWRANNPGNLRDAPTKIGTAPGAVGTFAVFATEEDGRDAQKALYLKKYGDMTVNDAVTKLTPPEENDTVAYLAKLKKAGVDLTKKVKDQIDLLMSAIKANEGTITGVEVTRAK